MRKDKGSQRPEHQIQLDVNQIVRCLPNVKSWRELAKNFSLEKSGSCVTILKRTLENAGLNVVEATKHFKRPLTVDEILSIRPNMHKGQLRKALLKTGRKYECEECHLKPLWCGKKLVLQVDHINGIPYDHRRENLRFLCPNCHSQTDTFCGKNLKREL